MRALSFCLVWGFPILLSAATPSTETLPDPPPLPSIQSLIVDPPSLSLTDLRDSRRVLVWGKTATGEKIDLTPEARFKSESDKATVAGNVFHAKSAGDAAFVVTAAGHSANLLVKVLNAENPPVRFVRDIEPVLSKVGCNAGTCHGSAKGKNGFKLSLRGYDPDYDYQALINDIAGRRFNRVDVDQSLMLLKPTAEVPHEGQQVIKPGSPEFQLLRQWIAEGTRFEDPVKARATRVEVLPAEIRLDLPGRRQQIVVLAHYPDGSTRDVTDEAVLTSNNEDVAKVKEGGLVTGIRRGEAAVLIRYEGNYATQQIAVMGDRSAYAWTDVPEYNYIDGLVNAKLRKMKILPSELCTDTEFLRRVTLDLTGQIPQPDRVRAFMQDPTPSKEKRAKLIEELLAKPGYAECWANKWADLLQCNSETLGQKGVWVYREWIRDQIARNTPYDKFVRTLLLARGSSFKNPAVNYYRVLREPDKITEDVSQTFLGTRFNCNKCHDHPFERWTQDQYYQFGAYFAQVAIKRGTMPGEEVIYKNYNGGEVTHPKTGAVVGPRVPYGQAPAEADRRDAFVDWLTSKENPLFAKSMANRLWSYFFGRGIIDPVDDIRGSNPASNAPLLDGLTEDFIRSGFDLKQLMRTICQSRTYQLSFRANTWNEDDSVNFSHALPRRLSAEQLLDAIAIATGHRPSFTGAPKGMRAVELPDGMTDDFLTLFGRPKRQSACECERTSKLTLSHAMNLINGKMIGDAVSAPDNRMQTFSESGGDNRKLVEDVYLSCLSRFPAEKEIATVEFPAGVSRLEVAQDLAWALLNSSAFLFNR